MRIEKITSTIIYDTKDRFHSYKGKPSIEKFKDNKLIERFYHKNGNLFHKSKFAKVVSSDGIILSTIEFNNNKIEKCYDFDEDGSIISYYLQTQKRSVSFDFNLGNTIERFSFTDYKATNISFFKDDKGFSYDIKYKGRYSSYMYISLSKSEWILYKYHVDLLISQNKLIPCIKVKGKYILDIKNLL